MTKKPIIITAAAALAVVVAILIARKAGLFGPAQSDAGEEAYVMSVGDITGLGLSVDRFSGVVESQETWKIDQNPEYTVKEIYVAVGDEVKKGDPLFAYDEEKFQADLSQAEIDLERLNAEKDGLATTISELTKEKGKAPASEQANYTIQIQQQELEMKQKELEIKSKQLEIDKLKENIGSATVTSGIDGIVQSVNDGSSTQMGYGEPDTSFIKIMKTGDLRIKGKVNEQNIGQLYEGMPITVRSRVDDSTWQGTLTTIDRESAENGQNGYYGGDTSSMSSSYPFYVELENSEGLMLGQHVYLTETGEGDTDEEPGIWLDSYYIDETDPASPFVWADDGSGKLIKKPVVIGERDEETSRYKVTDGLEVTDKIAFPDETLKEGMACVDESEMAAGNEEMATEEGVETMDGMEDMGPMEDMGAMEDMGGGAVG